MNFANSMTNSVSDDDEQLLQESALILRALFLIGIERAQNNKKWSILVDCHSIARLLSMIMENCRLVDGFILGLKKIGDEEFKIIDTCHSWLMTPSGAIIDPYPMGIIPSGGVLLIPTTQESMYVHHGANLYHEDPRVRNHFNVTSSWKRARSHRDILREGCDDAMMEKCVDYITKF